jgi:biopolymer transport protein ExbB
MPNILVARHRQTQNNKESTSMDSIKANDFVLWAEGQYADLLDLGGPVMWPLLCVSVWLWTLVLERYWFMLYRFPRLLELLAWPTEPTRPAIVVETEIQLAIQRYLNLIKTLSGILPMLGLLGTVTGIVETFDLIRIFGSAETRIVARGVSQALITTLAGLVLGLFGLWASHDLKQRALVCERCLGLWRAEL